MRIFSTQGLYRYIKLNSGFSGHTIHSAINSLGFQLQQSTKHFKELSCILRTCSRCGASLGFPGFHSHDETSKFFLKHRSDIVSHMEKYTAKSGINIITMIKNNGIFRYCIRKPTLCDIGKALWDNSHYWPEYKHIYTVFSWYTLERISHTWNKYLEENPDIAEKISA